MQSLGVFGSLDGFGVLGFGTCSASRAEGEGSVEHAPDVVCSQGL